MGPDLLNRIAMWGSIVIVSVVAVAVGANVVSDTPNTPESLSTSTLPMTLTAPTSGDIPIRRAAPTPTTATTTTATLPPATTTMPVTSVESESDEESDPLPEAPSTTATTPATIATTTTEPPPTTAATTTTTEPPPTTAATTTTTVPATTTTTIPETTTTEAPPATTPELASLFVTGFSGRAVEDDDGWFAVLSIRLGSTDSESRKASVAIAWTGVSTGARVVLTGTNGRATVSIGPLPEGAITFTITDVTADGRIYSPGLNTAKTSLTLEGTVD